MRLSVALAALVACGGTKQTSPGTEPVPAPAPTASAASEPLRVELGECGGAETSFVSGPHTPAVTGYGNAGTIGSGGGGTGTGQGFGSGAGRGGMKGRSTAVPTITLGAPGTQRDADKAIIRRVIRRSLPRLRYCYEKALLTVPNLSGTVTARFTVEPTGRVSKSRAAGVHRDVAGCVAGVVSRLTFPSTPGGGALMVSYPFVFRPDGTTSAPAAQPAPADSSPEWVTAPPAPADEAASGGDGVIGEEGKRVGLRGFTASAEVIPPEASPLRGSEEAIRACLAKQPARHGTLVFELAADGGANRVHGAGGGEADECLLAIAARIERPTGAPGQRCALAFGKVAPADAPGVELGAAAAAPPALEDVTGNGIVKGPFVVRADHETTMGRVHRVLEAARRAGLSPVLAARRDGAWRLLRAATLPEAPHASVSGAVFGSGEPEVHLSILVHADGAISVGTTRGETIRVGAGQTQQADLERVLGEHRNAAFAGRSDVDVGGEDTARYGALVLAIESTARAGFTDWTVAEPDRLSVRFTE